MKSYGQFCPIAKAAEIFCERWTALIVRNLAVGASHFSELHRGVPLMSPTLLSRRLKQLEAEGVVERRREAAGRGPSYHLTAAGQEFVPLVQALGAWGRRWMRRELAEGEIDLGLLLWGLEWSVRADAFGPGRTVVRIEFTDQPRHKALWWFVNEAGTVGLCTEDPGHEVDLYLAATLRDMIHIYRGDLPLGRALDSGRLEALGSQRARRALGAWLNAALVPETAARERGAPAR